MTDNRKRWNSSLSQAASLEASMTEALNELSSASLCLPDGTALMVKSRNAADLGTLPQAASLCQGYLKLKVGEIALTNDPFSGGTTLSDYTLVMGLALDGTPLNAEADLLLASRVSFPLIISTKGLLDEEGVRIPPMPIAPSGVINTGILSAIASHPLAPPSLTSKLENAIAQLKRVANLISRLIAEPGSELRRANLKRYLHDSGKAFEAQMHRLPLGTVIVSQRLVSGELIKLQLKATEDRLFFDFAGTEASQLINLTELATFGACFAATAAALETPVAMNSGAFDRLSVSTPSRTLLSAKAPSATARGMSQGVAAVCDLVMTAFTRLHSSFRSAQGAGFPALCNLKFASGKVLSLAVAPGSSARASRKGVDGIALWSDRSHFDVMPIEEIESQYPVHVLAAGLRAGSGGKGKMKGGDGSYFSLLLHEDAELNWSFGSQIKKQEGSEEARSGSQLLLEVVSHEGARQDMVGHDGQSKVKAGEQVHVLTAGGGGFGSTGSKDADDED